MGEATAEHVVPECHGGRLSRENIAMTCKRCNHNRGSNKVLTYAIPRDWDI